MYERKDKPNNSPIRMAAIFLLSAATSFASADTVTNGANELRLDSTLHGGLSSEQGHGKQGDTATYLVVLEEEALANYSGGKNNLAGTSIRATGGTKLNTRSDAARAYVNHLRERQNDTISRIAGSGKSAEPTHRYFYAVNGFSMRMSAEQAANARNVSGVRSVQRDVAYDIETDRGPQLIGAPTVWSGDATGIPAKGEGMVVGILDSGINQGHPAFAEVGGDGYGANGEYADSNPYGAGNFAGGDRDDCSNEDFTGLCNNKLIGSHTFLDAYNGVDQFAPPTDPVSKDTDGHGSHVASTAAGNQLVLPPLFNVDGGDTGLSLGNTSGVAPHAHIIAYKVCAPSCFASDIGAAIDQAIIDGADALNHSIGAAGGSPWSDFKSLAFKGARAAGIMLQNSAGNSGPAAGTAGRINASPWVTGVGASTHDRAFPQKTLEDLAGGDTTPPATMVGNSITDSFSGDIVWAGDFPVGAPGEANFDQPEQCLEAFPAGTFTSSQIVVCDRGAIARVQKARNVRDGGASAMVLANVQGGATSTNDDLHVIPAIHIDADNGDALRAWLASGTGHSATITATGAVTTDANAADVLAGFSSRGPYTGFDWLAPHVAAPGSAIYAAGADLQFVHGGLETPDPNDNPSVIPAYGIISGTSMASPHATGAATLLRQIRPDLTPAEVASLMMTTGVTDMRKEDGSTPADPFDFGGGRVNLADASRAALVLNETIANFDAADPDLGGDPATLNLAALVSNTCVLNCGWERTVRNASDVTVSYNASGAADDGMVVNISPASFTLEPGASQVLNIEADTSLADAGWNFGEVVLTPGGAGKSGVELPQQHITVAALFTTASNAALFNKTASEEAASVGQVIGYEINLTNISETGTYVMEDALPANATFVEGSEATQLNGGVETTPFGLSADGTALVWEGTLDTGGINVVSDPFPPAGSPFGYVSLPANGVAPLACSGVCDDTTSTLTGLPPFQFAGNTYTSIVVSSNGYIVAGEDTTGASTASNSSLPSAAAPNTVIAPFWTDLDLDGTNPDDPGAGSWYAGAFNSGAFIIIEWNGAERFNEPGPTYTFQIQIGTDLAPAASQGIWFVYNTIPTIPNDNLTVGAESEGGLFGTNFYFNGTGTPPITGDLGDLRVDSSAGGSATFTFDVEVGGTVGDTVVNVATATSDSSEETAIAVTEIAFIDTDGDGTEDFEDNCLAVANASQCDSDGDGFGNHCDADFDNNGFVNFVDLALLRVGFLGASDAPDYSPLDLNCDGAVNFSDLSSFKPMFGTVPGPSANE
ncbi:MAG: S8 family serine peptidase [Gammaproteobacteria bacterium]